MSAFNAGTVHGIFADTRVGLDQIRAAGWTIYANEGGWWFDRRETVDGQSQLVDRQYVPCWVLELMRREHQRGRREVQSDMRASLGLDSSGPEMNYEVRE